MIMSGYMLRILIVLGGQTFNKNNKLEKTLHVKWEYVKDTIKGDGTILERSEFYKKFRSRFFNF